MASIIITSIKMKCDVGMVPCQKQKEQGTDNSRIKQSYITHPYIFCFALLFYTYRITGNFGGGFNLAIWRLKSQPPN